MTKANPTNNTAAKKEKDPTKKKAEPKVVMSTNFSPVKVAALKNKRSTWGNYVDIYETLVLPIVIAVFIRMDNSDGSYITPFVKALKNDDTCELSTEWKIMAFLSRRSEEDDEETRGKKAMTKGPNHNFEWESGIAFVDRTREDAKEVGKNIAKQFSAFSKSDSQVRGESNYYVIMTFKNFVELANLNCFIHHNDIASLSAERDSFCFSQCSWY